MRPALRLLPDLPGDIEHASQIRAMVQRPLAGPLNHRPIGYGIAERHAQFDNIGARANGSQRDIARCVEVRIAARDVGD
jgi:hypothetical protein